MAQNDINVTTCCSTWKVLATLIIEVNDVRSINSRQTTLYYFLWAAFANAFGESCSPQNIPQQVAQVISPSHSRLAPVIYRYSTPTSSEAATDVGDKLLIFFCNVAQGNVTELHHLRARNTLLKVVKVPVHVHVYTDNKHNNGR